MKNLLIYISPTGKFDKEHEDLTKIQIDNSLELGWDVKDLMLVTNFPYEYAGVKAVVLGGELNALDGNRSSKIPAILKLDLTDDLYWFHDHDAFQLEPFKNSVAGFTDHGWSKLWNAGSFFFWREDRPLFQKIYETMIERNCNEQSALTYLWEQGLECKMLNITYNLNITDIARNIRRADKPIMVAHFHPHKKRHLDLFRFILPDRLITIFQKYGLN
jgi:hypothetical protein